MTAVIQGHTSLYRSQCLILPKIYLLNYTPHRELTGLTIKRFNLVGVHSALMYKENTHHLVKFYRSSLTFENGIDTKHKRIFSNRCYSK